MIEQLNYVLSSITGNLGYDKKIFFQFIIFSIKLQKCCDVWKLRWQLIYLALSINLPVTSSLDKLIVGSINVKTMLENVSKSSSCHFQVLIFSSNLSLTQKYSVYYKKTQRAANTHCKMMEQCIFLSFLLKQLINYHHSCY